MCLDDDIENSIYYTDTDSVHIPAKNLSRLAALYKQKYGKDLIGKDLGQFHSDFSAGEHGIPPSKNTEIFAIKSIFIGKKIYLDKLLYRDRRDNKLKICLHRRAKGSDSDQVTEAMFEAMLDGKEFKIDVAKNKPKFIRDRMGDISSRREFIRKIRKVPDQ